MGTLPIKRTTPVENFTETLRRKKDLQRRD